jgi:hypothetical protein
MQTTARAWRCDGTSLPSITIWAGEKVGSFAITEPDASMDLSVQAMQTNAVRKASSLPELSTASPGCLFETVSK